MAASRENYELLKDALRITIDALERLAFKSNTLGQKRDIARKALVEVEQHIKQCKENQGRRHG